MRTFKQGFRRTDNEFRDLFVPDCPRGRLASSFVSPSTARSPSRWPGSPSSGSSRGRARSARATRSPCGRRRSRPASPPRSRTPTSPAPAELARRRELDAAFTPELVGNLMRMKLWSPEGVVTYSNDPSIIGQRAADRRELAGVLSGRTVQRVTSLNDQGGTGEDVKAIESYVPIFVGNSSRPAGVLEVYEDYAPVAAEVRETVTPDRASRSGSRSCSSTRRSSPSSVRSPRSSRTATSASRSTPTPSRGRSRSAGRRRRGSTQPSATTAISSSSCPSSPTSTGSRS